jgi:hypothetical protein
LNLVSRILGKERRLACRITAHFTGMGSVVSPDTVNPTDRKNLVNAN